MRSPKKRIRHRDRNYMIYVLTFLIALTGMLGISRVVRFRQRKKRVHRREVFRLSARLRGWSCLCTVWQSMRSRAVLH